jgi:hypothetical protein
MGAAKLIGDERQRDADHEKTNLRRSSPPADSQQIRGCIIYG